MEQVIAIIGPTAVGKTALSFALAEYFHTELISGDAYQIYRHMNIGTAKPTADELQRYRHYLIDIAEPGESYSAATFCQMADAAIHEINKKHTIPILVGGTGLYVQSLLEGYQFGASHADETVRQDAKKAIQSFTTEELQSYIIAQTDWQPADWHELLANTNRLVRLMTAIHMGEGRQFVRATKADGLVYQAYVIGLSLPREVLYARIEKRIDMMLEAGWIDEVQQLLAQGISTDCQAMKAIGYQELAAYLQGTMPLELAVAQIKKRTRHFAKRQLTWYRRMPYIHWFEKNNYPSEDALIADVIHHIPFTKERI